jgi:uncharacterized protein YacL
MTGFVLRALFLLACASIGFQVSNARDEDVLWGILIGIAVALLVIALEIVLSKRPIQSISAIVFGLITGSILAILFYNILELMAINELAEQLLMDREQLRRILALSLALVCCYVCVMVIYKTRDRFRFIIPYVEFQKEEKGSRPIVIDTSAVIDGRLSDLCETGLFDTTMIIPKFVLQELQHVADSADRLRRNRGRRGLEMLQKLQRDDRLTIQIHDGRSARGNTVDSKLVSLAGQLQARILTCDYNLAKFAELQNVETINLNDISNSLRPTVLPGEDVALKIIRPGDEAGQGVGYLPDGTMVVVEGGRNRIDQMVNLVVTSTLQTSAGRMVFGRIRADHGGHEEKANSKKRVEREAST